MLENFLNPQYGVNKETFPQLERVTFKTARVSMNVVNGLFPNHIISRNGDITWLPRSRVSLSCEVTWRVKCIGIIHHEQLKHWTNGSDKRSFKAHREIWWITSRLAGKNIYDWTDVILPELYWKFSYIFVIHLNEYYSMKSPQSVRDVWNTLWWMYFYD